MYTKKQIMRVLEKAYEDSRYLLFGEQCSGNQELPGNMLERYAKASDGKLPAVMGLDLACYGLQLPQVGVNSEKWNTYIEQITDFAEKGGIVTASSHFANPIPRPEARALCRGAFGGLSAWEELLTEGTDLNKIFKDELLIDGEFLRQLGERGVTVLWRPLHEANSGAFWYCGRAHGEPGISWMDGEYLKRLWRYIYNLYVNEMGLTNLIWVYAPNNHHSWDGVCDVDYYYPGDEYVDMVGIDWYTNNKNEIISPKHPYDRMMRHGMPVALTEFGPHTALRASGIENQEKLFNSLDMVSLMKSLMKRGLKIAYVLTWTGGCGALYSIGKAAEALSDPFCITLEDMPGLYE
ncbi:MAG: hypothetical protein IKJ91_07945 [Clostridia bacterium]|nr:hypothetical protein [Clostridia bacterium]